MIEAAEMISKAVTEGGSSMTKKTTLVISALLSIVSILFFSLSPGAIKSAVHEATTEVIEIQLTPIKEELNKNGECIEKLEEIQSSQVLNSGIAAYKKFESVEIEDLPGKLESSTQNAAAIMIALRVKSAKDVLFQLDPDRTRYYQDYFKIE